MTCFVSLIIIMSNPNTDFLPSWFGEHTKQLVGSDTEHEYPKNRSKGFIAAAVLNRLSMWSSHDDDAKHAMPFAQADVIRYIAGTVKPGTRSATSNSTSSVVLDFFKHATGQTIEGFNHLDTGEDHQAAHRNVSCLIPDESSKVDDATWNAFCQAHSTALDTLRVPLGEERVDDDGKDVSQVARHRAQPTTHAHEAWMTCSLDEVPRSTEPIEAPLETSEPRSCCGIL